MNFYIKQNATLPELLLMPFRDGRYDYLGGKIVKLDSTESINDIAEKLANSSVTFSMRDVETGMLKVANAEAEFVLYESREDTNIKQLLLKYQFTSSDTNREGTYLGEFKIDILDTNQNNLKTGELIVPIKNELYIHVLSSKIKSTTSYIY